MSRPRIVVGQGEWTTDTEANLQRMEAFVDGLSADWGDLVDLVTFCEYAVTGWDPRLVSPESAHPIPGMVTERLGALAQKSGYYICNGSMLERAEEGVYNTALIFGPDGEIVHKYRKTFPWSQGAENVKEGREFPVSDLPGVGKVGTMICYDGMMPECARALAFNGAEIILWNSMAFHPLTDVTVAAATSRAFENSCYIVLACGSGTHVGLGLIGNSMFVDPNGVVMSRAGDAPTLFMDVVDTEIVKAARTYGSKSMCRPLETLAQFAHDYPQYRYASSGK